MYADIWNFFVSLHHQSNRKTMNKREYAKANLDWLAAKAEEDGVKALPCGVYYKVLSEGVNDGRHPSPRAIRLCDLIEGWIVAMQQMCVGDKWEVYIPASMGYGKFSQPGIPGGSTLVFEIELLGIS